MTSRPAIEDLPARDLASRIRAGLDAAGHRDIGVDALWIMNGRPGDPLVIEVPVGADLMIPLTPRGGCGDSASDLAQHVDWFVEALINLKQAETLLVGYTEEVRGAAREQIAAARADGLDLLLEGVGLRPISAWMLSGLSATDAADHITAAVRVRCTSSFLRREVLEIWVENAEDVAKEFGPVLDVQRERQEQLARLRALGADLSVDSITIDLLKVHGFTPEQVLRDIAEQPSLTLKTADDGQCVWLSLINDAGRVSATMQTSQAHWNGEHLWFAREQTLTDVGQLVGGKLSSRIDHPLFSTLPIASVDVTQLGAALIGFRATEHLFDVHTGRIWSQERLAA